jgi:NhaA family Na+:H+ antiporter
MSFSDLAKPLPLGILMGLVIGKPVGVLAGLAVGHWTGLARKPDNMKWLDYMAMAILCGIGFTMALFIGELAFETSVYRNDVKLGVLSASLLSAVIGWGLCRFSFRHK